MSVILTSLIGAGITAAASGIGSYFANKRKQKAEEAYRDSVNKEMEELDNEINANYLDSAEARNAINKVTESNKETLRQLNTDAIRSGATDEAKVAMASKLNKSTADVVGDLAVIGEQRKNKLETEKRALRKGVREHQYSLDSDVSGIYDVANTIGNAASTIAGAWATKPTATVSPEVSEAKTFMDNAGTIEIPSGDDLIKKQYDYGERY